MEMEENNDDDLNYNLDININLSHQRQLLESLKSKYKVDNKPSTVRSKSAKNSQRSVVSNSASISQSSSSSSNPSSQQSIKINSGNKKSTKTSTKTKASLFENVTVIIDFKLLENYGEQFLNELDTLEIKYELNNQVYSNLVTWYCIDDKLNDDSRREFETVLLILNWKDVVDYVNSSSFIQYIGSLSEVLTGKKITLGLYGFGNYFKYWKTHKQSSKLGKNADKNSSDYKNSVKISRHELEYVLTELELKYSCCHRFLETIQDLSQVICQYTKSIAQLPEKLQKNKKYKNIDFCLVKDNRDCVLIDKNGNGSRRLWQQQLTTFDLVRLETAEAILSKYPTPTQLFEAYRNCSKADGPKLLEDIPIRRAAGPLTTSRRIGPELSNKVYNFFKATDGNTVV